MRKFIRLLGFVILLAFLAIQFVRPDKNKGDSTDENHIFIQQQVPEEIKDILKEACLDCHSNQTRYLWYHNIAPVSWMVNKHIINGKEELNFSEWGKMDVFEKITILEEACQESKRRSMPLKSYTYMHPKAKLNDEQLAVLCNWTTSLSEELLRKATEK